MKQHSIFMAYSEANFIAGPQINQFNKHSHINKIQRKLSSGHNSNEETILLNVKLTAVVKDDTRLDTCIAIFFANILCQIMHIQRWGGNLTRGFRYQWVPGPMGAGSKSLVLLLLIPKVSVISHPACCVQKSQVIMFYLLHSLQN